MVCFSRAAVVTAILAAVLATNAFKAIEKSKVSRAKSDAKGNGETLLLLIKGSDYGF